MTVIFSDAGVQYANGTIQSSAAQDMIMPIAASVATNALTVTLPPEALVFRSTTLSSGASTPVQTDVTLSLTVPSGATLGTVSGVASRLVVLAIYTGTAVELAILNIAGGNQLDETNLISTTAISTASNSANVVYSTTARTSVPYRVMGFIDSTQATAGTWASAPSLVQGVGGQAAQHVGKILGSVAVTATGTSVDFIGIPAFVKRITVALNGVSLSATADILVQIGPAGGVETTGYSSSGSAIAGVVNTVTSTAGFVVQAGSAAAVQSGHIHITNFSGSIWVQSHVTGRSDAAATRVGGGTKTIAGALSTLRVTTTATDTFDAGSISLLYE